MERKFYTDDFESLLKENADQFRMIPSKKVWHGIYNDMHPGRRWPSVAIGSLFIFTLVVIGYLNTRQSEHSRLAKVQKGVQLLKKNIAVNLNTSQHERGKIEISQKSSQVVNSVAPQNSNYAGKVNPPNQPRSNKNKVKAGAHESSVPPAENTDFTDGMITGNMDNKEKVTNNNSAANISVYGQPVANANVSGGTSVTDVKNDGNKMVAMEVPGKEDAPNVPYSNVPKISNGAISAAVANKHIDKVAPPTEKASPHVFFLQKIYKSSRINWTYYLSPGISYRVYSKKRDNANAALAGLIYSNADLNKVVKHRPSPGIEAGTAMKYAVTNNLKFTAGFQLNYSTYSVEANNIHPIIASLLLYSEKAAMPYTVSSISYYGNGPGTAPIKLHNYSVQVSLPVGLEYKITGNDDISLDAAASIQPSFIVTNQAYLLSTDKRNYLTQADLTRKWNVGTNIGTFITVNSKKLQWQVGPQVHYQLLSSYKSEYHLREHFIDYSIRLGVSKIINR